jgi:3',5'-cyclic AMP phosphodiesterase CpdA
MASSGVLAHQDLQYVGTRLQNFEGLLDGPALRNIPVDVVRGVFEFLLTSQGADGAWRDPDGKWTVVQTAVILKAFGRLGYTTACTWPIASGGKAARGGVQKALDFFTTTGVKLHPNDIPNADVEDIWDSCQALLSFAAFGKRNDYRSVVDYISANWEATYDTAMSRPGDSWAGPAFLAAILDVLIAYDCDPDRQREALQALLATESGDAPAYSTFLWPARSAEPVWQSALVLRSLCRLPEALLKREEKEEIAGRVTRGIIDERNPAGNGGLQPCWGRKALDRDIPMYTCRALESLVEALPFVEKTRAKEVEDAIEKGNQYLASCAAREPGHSRVKIGTIKATTAAAEYFSALKTPIPAAVLVDAASCLSTQIKVNAAYRQFGTFFGNPYVVPGGLRIAWLSDLHVGDVKDSGRLFRFTRRKLFRSLFQGRKTCWTEPYASANLDHIVAHIQELNVSHVLVTGDIANLALEEQFEAARNKFLSLQAGLGKGPPGKLSPEFWTILPGNHDVDKTAGQKKLSHFMEVFSDLYDSSAGQMAFPVVRHIVSPAPSGFAVDVVGIDSSPHLSVEVLGMNARGEISDEQFGKFRNRLVDLHGKKAFVIVALHHHPIVVPYVKSKWEEFFMSLDTDDANLLVSSCCEFGVRAILHGHYHAYSAWFAPVGLPKAVKRFMPIIGAPCSTTGAPGEDVEFLELVEVELENFSESLAGLALYRHRLADAQAGRWECESLGLHLY